ncbi:membrane protein [Actinorhabdospora filicis]|uniref:Membrane protein n=1 Tax=Actinorhabdospora filicis TaxID=1785913 RepID=A0A9W6SG58_9ACTN|nr:threonine/serine exporter family protein [Actinorhabdospora filicis]GLZ75403.1 membrane protein [Actinorhabdospora filicis]
MGEKPKDPVLDLAASLAGVLVTGGYEGTELAERRLRRLGEVYGRDVAAVVLPESATVSLDGRARVVTGLPGVPPLHRVSALKTWYAAVLDGRSGVDEAAARLDRIRASPRLYGPALRVIGTALFTLGFGVSLQPTWQQAAWSAALGLFIGLLTTATDAAARLRWIAPLLASVAVSLAVLWADERGWITGGPIPLMVPALFVFIPGDSITMAMVELSTGRVTAGAARLTESLAGLAVLAFGPIVALALLGLPAASLTDDTAPASMGVLAGILGWTVFTVGVMLVFDMRARDLPWALAVVLITYGAQLLFVRLTGDTAGTYLAAVTMTAACLLLERRPGSPPVYVLYLTAFFTLTPGSHGLRGLDAWIGGDRIAGLTGLTSMLALLTAIALGILTGAAIGPRSRGFRRETVDA